MISRKLLAALVGLSLATASLSTASAQTIGAAAKTAPVVTSAKAARVYHGTRMHKPMHRKHLAAKPATKRVHVSRATRHASKHV